MKILVFAKNDINIFWNGVSTFNVYHNDDNIDCFTVNDVDNSSDAIWHAREWIEDQERSFDYEVAQS